MEPIAVVAESDPRRKSAPVRPHPRAYQRSYLGSLLSSHFDIPLVVVEAPRGYGKTTLLAALAHRSGANVRWLTLDDGDRDVSTLVANLCSSIYRSPVGESLGQTTGISQGARLIHSALKELSVDTLILDNYETVVSSDSINSLIEQIVTEMPPLTHLVIASQKTPPFKRGSRVRSRMTEINFSDLRFDADDVAGYFETIARYKLSPAEAGLIVQRTNGQPVTVNLLAQLAYGLQSYLRINFDALLLAPGEQTLIYLLREVLKRLPFSLEQAARIFSDLRMAREAKVQSDEATDAETRPSLDDAVKAALPLLDRLAAQYCLVNELDGDERALLPHPMLFEIGSLL